MDNREGNRTEEYRKLAAQRRAERAATNWQEARYQYLAERLRRFLAEGLELWAVAERLGLSMEELRPLARRARVKLVPTRELQ